MNIEKLVENYIDNKIPTLKMTDTINFSCKMCGKCCRNRNVILLSPYDIYRACKYLKIKPIDFIHKYCYFYVGHESNLPLLILKFKEGFGYTFCPFLKKKVENFVCTIQDAKPTVCALFPVSRFYQPQKDIIDYVYQDACGSKDSTITLQDWLSMYNLQDSEECFKIYGQAIEDVESIIDLKKFRKTESCKEYQSLFYSIMLYLMYMKFDFDKDVLQNIKENMEQLTEFVKVFISYLLIKGLADVRGMKRIKPVSTNPVELFAMLKQYIPQQNEA